MNLRQFDLNLLVALDALLIERNVTRAGERLHLSQPAMSGILARLRHVFNDELLVRVGRHLEPTAFAAELARPVRACVQQIEDLLSTQRVFSPQTEARTFVIAASDYVVLLLLGPLVKRLTALAPNIGVRFVSLESSVADRFSTRSARASRSLRSRRRGSSETTTVAMARKRGPPRRTRSWRQPTRA